MENINKEKLFNFLINAGLLFFLFIIIYLMYMEYVIKKISNFNNISVNEKFNNLINIKSNKSKLSYPNKKILDSPETYSNIEPKLDKNVTNVIQENFNCIIDPKKKFYIKRDCSTILDAKCYEGDIVFSNNQIPKCSIAPEQFYLNQENSDYTISINVIPDYNSSKNKTNKNFYYPIVTNNKSIPKNTTTTLKEYRSNFFSFSDDNTPKKFDSSNPIVLQIVDYYNRYNLYKNYIDNSKNISPSSTDIIINDFKNLLLLKNNNIYKLPINFNDIKDKILNLYGQHYNNDKEKNCNLEITDNTNLQCIIDSKISKSTTPLIYNIIINIDLEIKFIGLIPHDSEKDKSIINDAR